MDTNEYIESTIKYLSAMDDTGLAYLRGKATGKTVRLCDKLVQDFFTAPYGEWVPVQDHYWTRQADEMLFNHFMRRMETEHPNIEVEVKHIDGIYVRRKNKLFNELVAEEYNKRQENKKNERN